MTAISLFVQPMAVHLVTDAAYYDAAGVVVEMRSKVTLAAPLRMAIACSGCVKDLQIANELGAVNTQSEGMSRLPAAVEAIRAHNRLHNPGGEAGGHNEFMMFVAIWSERSKRTEGWVIASDQAYLGDSYRPGTLIEVERLSSPPSSFDLSKFEASAASKLLNAQRARSAKADDACYVGGFGELTSVTATGVHQQRICDWPDRVGERIAA